MKLVQPIKGQAGQWEVPWTWLPYFLASDRNLIKVVDRALTETFGGQPGTPDTEELMSELVKKTILDKYPITGLRALLQSYEYVQL